MSERIRELIKQATVFEYNEVFNLELDRFDKEKFAELIVKECLTIVDDLIDRQADGSWTSNELYTDYNGALHLADQQIRKHFGIEE